MAGLTTTAQPAASAGASFQTTSATGKFQGVIAATTPTGAGRTQLPVASVGPGSCWAHIRSASAAKWWTTSARAGDLGLGLAEGLAGLAVDQLGEPPAARR